MPEAYGMDGWSVGSGDGQRGKGDDRGQERTQWVLTATYSGRVSWFFGAVQQVEVKDGQVMLCRFDDVTQVRAEGEESRWMYLRICGGGELLRWLLSDEVFLCCCDTGGTVGRLLGRLCRRLQEGSSGIYRNSADMYQLLMAFGSVSRKAVRALSPVVRQAADLLERDFACIASTEELARRVGVSKSHLIRSFTRQLGVSPGQYLEGIRMEYAKLLLRYKDYALETVADLVGYSGANYFCKVFRKSQGMTPGQYRKFWAAQPRGENVPPKKLLEWEKREHW